MIEWLLTHPLISIFAVSTIVGAGVGLVKIGVWVGKVDEHKRNVHTLMKEIRKDIKEILGRLGPVVATSGSPIELTDLGISVSKALDASTWAQQEAKKLASRIEGMQPYDIEVMSHEYVSGEFEPEEDMEAKIKQCAFENGLESEQVYRVLAIELRDKPLEQLPKSLK